MAWIVAAESDLSSSSASYTQPIPDGHQSGDILLAILSQDGGGTTIAVSGWTQIGTQAAAGAQRTTAFWKLAASSSEADLSATGATDEWAVTILVVRGANTSTPIDVQARADFASNVSSMAAPASTTTSANALAIWAWGADGSNNYLLPDAPASAREVAKVNQGTIAHIVGAYNAASAAALPTPSARLTLSDGGQALTIAIKDADGSAAPRVSQLPATIKLFSSFSTLHESLSFAAISDIAGSIGGVTCYTGAPTPVVSTAVLPASGWGGVIALGTATTASAASGMWVGGVQTISSTNMAGRLFSVEIGYSEQTRVELMVDGLIVVFRDNSGNWAAFRATGNSGGFRANVLYRIFIDVDAFTPIASSGTIDWTQITGLGFAARRGTTATTSARNIWLHSANLHDKTIVVGGSASLPVTQEAVAGLTAPWEYAGQSSLQGGSQTLIRSSLQLGDGSTATRVRFVGGSLAFPRQHASSLAARFWAVDEDAAEVRVKASGSDVIDLSSSVLSTEVRQAFVIDPASNAGATFNFAGAVFVGWNVTNSVSGVVFNGASFANCHTITLLGGGMEGCSVSGSPAASAVVTSDPGQISDTVFVAGDGHAVEITTPGTYAFAGNTFSGYGANGTTDAAVYNNSGGAVTLNITGGGDTPTVRNGTGASTTVNGGATLTLTGLIAGSDIVILDAGTTTERVNVDANAGTTYAYNYTATGNVDIGVFKTGYVPLYVRGFTLTTSDATLPIAQAVDRGYLNP